MQYSIMVSGVAPALYPTETFFGIFNCADDDIIEIPKMYPFIGEWGVPTGIYLGMREKYSMPKKIDMIWLSICEKRFYSIEYDLDSRKFENIWNKHSEICPGHSYQYIVVGMGPFGGVAIWFYEDAKSTIIEWAKADPINVSMSDFIPENPSIQLEQYCNSYINKNLLVKKNIIEHGLPLPKTFIKYMQQFTYRYVLLFEKWKGNEDKWVKHEDDETVPVLEYMEEALFDGTHDKLHDGGLMKYHQAGKPKKLAVQWHIKKSEYSAYFWFEDERIREVFDKFYGVHPNTKTDFIIRIDAEQKKYELALYRYGLKEPQIIPEDAYQLLVFKNKFEDYRSENYNQERGAWIW